METNLSIANRSLPPHFEKLVRLSYSPRPITVLPVVASSDTYKFEYPSKRVISADNVKPLEVDCVASHFHGIRAGDIVTDSSHKSLWCEQIVFVEGYSYNYVNNYSEYQIVLWGRIINDRGLKSVIHYDSTGSTLRIIKKRGEYNPEKDYGFNPLTGYSVDRTDKKIDRLKELTDLHSARESVQMQEPLPLEMVFNRFVTTLLVAEITDVLRRTNNLFPLADRHRLERELISCDSPAALESAHNRIFGNFQAFLKGTYSESSIDKILNLISRGRACLDYEKIIINALSWLIKGICFKIGLKIRTSIPEENIIDSMSRILNDIMEEVANYLAPLFDISNEDQSVCVFCNKPVYFETLVSSYSNPVEAARHVVAVVLNSVSEIFERGYSYDFRHIVNQDVALVRDPNKMVEFRTDFFCNTEYVDVVFNAFNVLFDEFEAKLKKTLTSQLSISRKTSIGFIIKRFHKTRDVLIGIIDLFLRKVDEKIKDAIATSGGALSEDFFEQQRKQLVKRIERLKESVVSLDQYKIFINSAIDAFAENPDLTLFEFAFTAIDLVYPLESVQIGGKYWVDCIRDDFGFSGGDIVKYEGGYYFFEGYFLEDNKATNLAIRRIRDHRIDFSSATWPQIDKEVNLHDFEVSLRWGYYNPREYDYSPLDRRDEFKLVRAGYLELFIASIRDGFLKPVVALKRKRPTYNLGSIIGSSVLDTIVAQVNDPRGKQLPLNLRLLYSDRDFYSAYPFAPPSASGKNVIRFEISTGCDWRKCTYCSLYEKEEFSLIRFGRFKDHFALIQEYMGKRDLADNFNRVFLSGGNGFIMPTNRLVEILEYINRYKGGDIRRIESYATTKAIIRHGEDGLRRLERQGLNLVYWGCEAGDDTVLGLVDKGFTVAEILEAANFLRNAEIFASVTVMPGLGGIKYADEHAKGIAEVMAKVFPRYLTLMGVFAPESLYEQQLLASGDNRPLTREEMIAHMNKIKDRYIQLAGESLFINALHTRIAAYSPDVTPAAYNPISFEHQM